MTRLAKPSRALRVKPLLPEVKTLAAILAVAVLLTVGQVTLQARMVEAQTTQAELQVQEEQARAELQAQIEQARIEAQIQAQNVAADRAALVALYDATGGDSWTTNTNWKSNQSLGDWHGVTTDSSGRVTLLVIPDNNLTGTLPAELGNLNLLRGLSLYDNNLTGPIPPELGNLDQVIQLSLYDNNLTGTIPPRLYLMSSLQSALLRNNSLTGTVPPQLSRLSSLLTLSLNNNQLTGQLPQEFTEFARLSHLQYQGNAGLCAPLESAFRSWLGTLTTNEGPDCPRASIWTGAAAPVVGEPVTVRLTSQDDLLTRIGATQQAYDANPCIGYSGSGTPLWAWERADADSNDPNSPDDSTWTRVGFQAWASFVHIPEAGDVGKFLRSSLTIGSPAQTVTTAAIGPIAAAHGVSSGDIVSVAYTGELAVAESVTATLPAAAAERWDRRIEAQPNWWQWERSDDGSSNWDTITPYRQFCDTPDTQLALTFLSQNKYLRGYVYYNDDSSGSIVLKRGELASVGPVVP